MPAFKGKIPKKRTIHEAKQGKKNTIRIAFDCRMLKNVLVDNMPFDIYTMNSDVVGSGVDKLCISNVSLGQANKDRVLPSHLLSDKNWVPNELSVALVGMPNRKECVDWFAEWKVCGKDPLAIPLTVLLHLDHLFVQNFHLFNVVWGAWVLLY
jgi:hypothetical protein